MPDLQNQIEALQRRVGELERRTPKPVRLAPPPVGGGDEVWVFQVNGGCNERGTYTGKGYRVDVTDVQCANDRALALPEGMTGEVDVLIINTEENGFTPAHWLEQDGSGWGFGVRRGTDVDGWPIIVTNGGKYRTSGGATLGEAGMKDSHVLGPDGEPDGAFWQRPSADAPFSVWLVTGFQIDPGSPGNCNDHPPALWMYKRMFTEDAGGRLNAVTTEVATVLSVGCCPPQTTISSASFGASDAEATAAAANLSRISVGGVA